MTFAALGIRTLALFTVGALLMALGTVGKPKAVRGARVLKFVIYFVIVHAVVALCAVGGMAPAVLVAAIVAVSTWEAVRAGARIAPPRPWVLASVAAAVAGAAVIAALRLSPYAIAWLFIVTGACDGFAQVIGQWIGRHPLAPRVSPEKTIEGMLGGVTGAVLVAVWLRELTPFTALGATIVGGTVAGAALVGDLCGSWVKRRAGIKDFSRLLPGQGGVLDRFNSFLAALGTVGLLFALAGYTR